MDRKSAVRSQTMPHLRVRPLMNETALGECRKGPNFPMGRLIGMSWSASDAELRLLGDVAKGYQRDVVEPALPGQGCAPTSRCDTGHVKRWRRQGRGGDHAAAGTVRAGLSAWRRRRRCLAVEAMQAGSVAFRSARYRPHAVPLGAGTAEIRRTKLVTRSGFNGLIAHVRPRCADHAGHAGLGCEWNGRPSSAKAGPLSCRPRRDRRLWPRPRGRYVEANRLGRANGACRP